MPKIRLGTAAVSTRRLPRVGAHVFSIAGFSLIAVALAASGPVSAGDNQPDSGRVPNSEQEIYANFLNYYIDWAQTIEAQGQNIGIALTPEQMALAAEIGIKKPEKVRLVFVDEVPFPKDNAEARAIGEKFGFIGSGITNNAQAFGYTIWVRKGFDLSRPRLAHELIHVLQIERSQNFALYAKQYLSELAQYGHDNAPLEVEAYRANEMYALK